MILPRIEQVCEEIKDRTPKALQVKKLEIGKGSTLRAVLNKAY
jgi:hypothetical protein